MALSGVSNTTSSSSCDFATTGASDEVANQITKFETTTENALDRTMSALDSLASNIRVGYSGANYGGLEGWRGTFSFNPSVAVPVYDHEVNLPDFNVDALKTDEIDPSIDTSGAPEYDVASVTPNYPRKPVTSDPVAPGSAPPVGAHELPDPIYLKDIADPLILAITIPENPETSFVEFTAKPPSTDGITPPADNFTWSEEDYDSAILQQVQGKVSEFLAGGVGIPDAIWNALWDKGVDRESKAGIKLTQEISEFFAESGFSLPNGAKAAKIQEAQQAVFDASNTLSREIAERQAVHEIENLKFAVQQGIALEGMLGGWYQAQLTRMLDAAKYSYQASVTLYEAQITLFNAELQLYNTEAEVYKSLLQAELTKLEVYKAELDGQRLLGDLNQQAIDLYIAQYKALETQISLYNSELQSVTIALEVDKTKLQAYGVEVDAYGKMIQAKVSEYDAYRAEVEAEKTKIDAFGIEVNAFSSRVSAYKTEIEAQGLAKTIAIDVNTGNIEVFKAQIDEYNSKVKAEVDVLDASVKTFSAEVQAYSVASDNERNRLDTDMEALKIDVNYASQKTQAYMNNAKIYTDKSVSEAGLSVEASKAVAAINAQITASSMSAVNLSMGMSDSAGNTVSCLK